MVFLQDGEASAASNGIGQNLIAVMELLRKMQEGFESGWKKNQLTEQDEKDIDNICAATTVDILERYGKEEMSPDGELKLVYEAEGFKLSRDALDLTGMPVYTVSTAGSDQPVFSFQKDPKEEGKFIFYETGQKLTKEQKRAFLQVFQNIQQNGLPEQKPGIDQVRANVSQLGDLAPKGSYAVAVADQVMDNARQDRVEGQFYVVARSGEPRDKQKIEVRSKEENKTIYRFDPQKGIDSTGATPQDGDRFKQMHLRLVQLPEQVKSTAQTTKPKPKAMAGVGER